MTSLPSTNLLLATERSTMLESSNQTQLPPRGLLEQIGPPKHDLHGFPDRRSLGSCSVTFGVRPFLQKRETHMSPMFSNTVMLAFTVTSMLLVGSKNAAGADEQDGKYRDSKFDFTVTVPKPWKNALLKDFTVPGVARSTYSRTSGASIVFFVQEPGKDFEPRFLVDESAKSMEKSLKAAVREKEVRTVAEKKAMWLVVEGDGTGGAIDGKGSVKTTQLWVAIPREKDVVVALLTSPTSEFPENRKSFEEAIKTLVVGGKQTAAQNESK